MVWLPSVVGVFWLESLLGWDRWRPALSAWRPESRHVGVWSRTESRHVGVGSRPESRHVGVGSRPESRHVRVRSRPYLWHHRTGFMRNNYGKFSYSGAAEQPWWLALCLCIVPRIIWISAYNRSLSRLEQLQRHTYVWFLGEIYETVQYGLCEISPQLRPFNTVSAEQFGVFATLWIMRVCCLCEIKPLIRRVINTVYAKLSVTSWEYGLCEICSQWRPLSTVYVRLFAT